MKQGIQNGKKLVSVDQIQVFVIINNVGKKINVDVNVKNQLIKVYKIKDLFGILVIVNANAINLVILMNIQIMKTVNVGKNQLTNQMKNVLKILKKQSELKKLQLKMSMKINAVLVQCILYFFQ